MSSSNKETHSRQGETYVLAMLMQFLKKIISEENTQNTWPEFPKPVKVNTGKRKSWDGKRTMGKI